LLKNLLVSELLPKNKVKKKAKLTTSTITLSFLVSVVFPLKTYAGVSVASIVSKGFSDTEDSIGNMIDTTTLDMVLRAGYDTFIPDEPLIPGGSVSRDIYVKNVGELPFKYSLGQKITGGDPDLCAELNLTVWYSWYDSPPPSSGSQETQRKDLVYTGPLSGFVDITSTDMLNPDDPNAKTYYDNIFYSENEHWFIFLLELDADAGGDFSENTCEFDIVVKAWQEDLSYEKGFYDIETLGSTVAFGEQVGEWADESALVATEVSEVMRLSFLEDEEDKEEAVSDGESVMEELIEDEDAEEGSSSEGVTEIEEEPEV